MNAEYITVVDYCVLDIPRVRLPLPFSLVGFSLVLTRSLVFLIHFICV